MQQVRRSGVRLTTQEERAEIRAIVEERTRALLDEDLAVLGYCEWLENLERGVAATTPACCRRSRRSSRSSSSASS